MKDFKGGAGRSEIDYALPALLLEVRPLPIHCQLEGLICLCIHLVVLHGMN